MVTPTAPVQRRPAATDFPALRQRIGEIRQVDGRDYHDGAQVIRWLNHTLLEGNWSQRIIDHGRDCDHEVWALVELSATLWIEDDEGILVPSTVTFQEFGSHRIELRRGTQIPTSIGNNRKAAVTDGLKRCARLLGIGLYLWDHEDMWELPAPYDADSEAQRERQLAGRNGTMAATGGPVAAPVTRPAPTPAHPAPAAPRAQEEALVLPAGERAALEHKYEALRVEAHDAGFMASWSANGPDRWTDIQLVKYIALFEGYLARRSRAAERGAA